MTFEARFEKLSKKLIEADISKLKEDFAVQVTLNDEDCGGTFFVAYSDGAYRVEPYDYFDNTAYINVFALALNKLIDKRITLDEAKEKGLISIGGNEEHFVQLLEAMPKKEEAKKTPKKQAAAKKDAPKKKAVKAPAKDKVKKAK